MDNVRKFERYLPKGSFQLREVCLVKHKQEDSKLFRPIGKLELKSAAFGS